MSEKQADLRENLQVQLVPLRTRVYLLAPVQPDSAGGRNIVDGVDLRGVLEDLLLDMTTLTPPLTPPSRLRVVVHVPERAL